MIVAAGSAMASLGVFAVALAASVGTRTFSKIFAAAAGAHIAAQAVFLYSVVAALGCPPLGPCVNVLFIGFIFALGLEIAATTIVALGAFLLFRLEPTSNPG